MLSYIDIRKLPFSDYWDGLRIGIWGDNRLSEAVCMWVNRMHDKTQLVVAYPGTSVARESVMRYVEAMRAEFARWPTASSSTRMPDVAIECRGLAKSFGKCG